MRKLSILALLLCINLSFAQTKEDAFRDANITSKATLKEDFKTVIKHTLPGVIEVMGGQEKGLKLIEEMFAGIKSQGFIFEKAEIISVSDVVFEQNQHRCVVKGLNQMAMGHNRYKSESYLLGIYNPEGKYWHFIEAKQMANKALLDIILPNFETQLVIPENTMTTEHIPH